jgi:cytochrome c-type biogenesis protein CcmH/NrfG
MKRNFSVLLVLASCVVAAPWPLGQAPAAGEPAAAGQSKPSGESKKPAQASQSSVNPFPEDTSTVPVMPATATPALPDGSYSGAESAPASLPGDDFDPVRSPDDPAPDTASGQPEESSSSRAGLESVLTRPDDDQPEKSKKKKLIVKEPTHQEAASKDIEVGVYYLQTKNWKAALSRFESALVLDPENPDVYWGLAEAARHLGNLADARANYQKVAEYDPDSRHGKEAIKALKEPEIANGKNPAMSQTPTAETQQ